MPVLYRTRDHPQRAIRYTNCGKKNLFSNALPQKKFICLESYKILAVTFFEYIYFIYGRFYHRQQRRAYLQHVFQYSVDSR